MNVKIGFAGVGTMGQAAHLRNFVLVEGCDVVAVSDPRSELLSRVAQRYGISKTYQDAETMMDAEELDAVVAIQPFDRHLQLIAPLFEAGIPLLTEKPLAADTGVARGLLDRLTASRATHIVGYHKRSDPGSVRARAVIRELRASGELGDLQYLRVTIPPGDWVGSGFDDLVSTGEASPALAPDGTTDPQYAEFVNYYIHQVNLARFLLDGEFEVSHAPSSGRLLVGRTSSGVDVIIELAPWADKIGWNETALAAFEGGWVRLDLPAPLDRSSVGVVTVHRTDGGEASDTRLAPAGAAAFLAQAQRFVRAVAEGFDTDDVLCQAPDALADLQIADDYVTLRGS